MKNVSLTVMLNVVKHLYTSTNALQIDFVERWFFTTLTSKMTGAFYFDTPSSGWKSESREHSTEPF